MAKNIYSNSYITQEERPANLFYQKALFYLHLSQTSSISEGKKHHLMTGVLFVAFAYEAMMYHYAKFLQPDIKETESRCKVHKTVRYKAGLEEHYRSKKPYKTLKDCLIVRDNIVHGKPIKRETFLHTPEGSTEDDKHHYMIDQPLNIEDLCSEEKLRTYIGSSTLGVEFAP